MTQNSGFPGSYISKNKEKYKNVSWRIQNSREKSNLELWKILVKNSDYFFTKLRVFAEKLRVKIEKNSGQKRQNSGFPGSSDIARYEKPPKKKPAYKL